MNTQTPKGIRDFIPQQTKSFEYILGKLSNFFESCQCQKIQTPTLEYFDSLAVGMGENLHHIAVKMLDSHGKILVLRPDHTVPIARLVASRKEELSFPLHLYYTNPIFRTHPYGIDRDVETFQAGVESIGTSGNQSDTELLSWCITSLLDLGLSDFGVDIGHVDFLQNLPTTNQKFLASNDYINLGYIPERGSVACVQDSPSLCHLYEGLCKQKLDAYVSFNKGLVPPLPYYSGIIFEVYSLKNKQRLAYGGRYDHLLSRYGLDCPAIGFALSVEALVREIDGLTCP